MANMAISVSFPQEGRASKPPAKAKIAHDQERRSTGR